MVSQSVTLHTNLGDMKLELFCEQVNTPRGIRPDTVLLVPSQPSC